MTPKLTIWLAIFIAAFFALDYYVFHLDAGLFLAKKGLDLINALAFWR